MNSFLSLFFCSLAPAVTFGWNVNEKPPFIPLSTTQNQRHNPRQLAPVPGQMLTVQKFLQLKYALELKCLKELCSHARYRHVCYGGKPFQPNLPTPPLQSIPQQQILYFNRMKENPTAFRTKSEQYGRYLPKEKMIYLPPNKYFNNMRMNPPPQGESKMSNNTQQKLSRILPSKIIQEENLSDQLLPQNKEFRDLSQRNTSKNEDITITDKPTNTTETSDKGKPAKEKPPSATTQPPKHIYEVRETIDEKPQSYQYSNDFKGFQMGSKKLANVSLLTEEEPDLQEFKNTSSVLKPEETTPALYPKPDHHPPVSVNETNDTPRIRKAEPRVKNLFNSYLRILRENNTAKPKTLATTLRSVTFRPEHVNKADLLRKTTQTETTSVYTSEVVMTETTVNRSGITKTESVEDVQLLGSTYHSNPDFTHSNTEESTKGSSLFPEVINSINPLTTTSSEFQTASSVFWKTTDNWSLGEDSSTSPASTKLFLDTTNEAGITTPRLKEITTEPDYNFFTKMKPEFKKDYDSSSKNSRKMHFGEETLKTTISNEISGFEYNVPRRSDILMNENDYFDYGNTYSDVSYLKKLQLNHSLDLQNLTSEDIIPLIPTVVNDLREGRIPTEELSALSEVFGKYWTTVMKLSNSAGLDMLPLMKLKDEKDLKKLLQSLQPEGSKETTTEAEDYNYFTLGSYDFIENYKDLTIGDNEQEASEEYNFDIINEAPQY